MTLNQTAANQNQKPTASNEGDVNQTPEDQDQIISVSSERKDVGKFLIRFAWAFEIVAVIIGLAIAMSTLLSSIEEMQTYRQVGLKVSDYTNIFIAAIPFVMVAMVEITKIPLTQTFYKTTSNVWKLVFGSCLALVCLITFESALNGFERNFSALMYTIDEPKKEVVTTNQLIAKSEDDRMRLLSLTLEDIDAEYNERYDQLFVQSTSQKSETQDQINLLRASIQTEYVDSLRQELASVRKDKTQLYKERSAALSREAALASERAKGLSTELASDRRGLNRQLITAEQAFEKMNDTARSEVKDANIFVKARVREDWDRKIEAKREEITEVRNLINSMGAAQKVDAIRDAEQTNKKMIRSQYDVDIAEKDKEIKRLSGEINKSIGSKELEIESNVLRYQEQLRDLDSEFQGQLETIKEKRSDNLTRLKNNEVLVDEIDQDLSSLRSRKIELVKEINQKVGTNQIYRIATWWANKESAAEVEKELVAAVALVWFGSLSLLVAVMGVFLALGSLVISDGRLPDVKVKKKNEIFSAKEKFYRLRRQFMIYRSRKRKVQKQIVEVDRVVFKEVPVEVVKKEFVHVPFYTNDERLLNIAGKDLDESTVDGTERDSNNDR